MSELERQLTALGAELDWPETPAFALRLEAASGRGARVAAAARGRDRARRRRDRHRVRRAAGAQRDPRLLPPRRRDDRARLDAAGRRRSGRSAPASAARVTYAEARRILGGAASGSGHERQPQLYEREGVISAVLATPEPVLVSELRPLGGGTLLKKVAGMSSRPSKTRRSTRSADGHLDRRRASTSSTGSTRRRASPATCCSGRTAA